VTPFRWPWPRRRRGSVRGLAVRRPLALPRSPRRLAWLYVAGGVVLAAGVVASWQAALRAPEPELLGEATTVASASAGGPAARSAPISPAILAQVPATRADLTRLALGEAAALEDWLKIDGRPGSPGDRSAVRVRYTLHPELMDEILTLLERQRVQLGQVLVADARTGRLLAYAATNREDFGPQRAYPAASLAKLVTAAATLESAPAAIDRPCVFQGSPYRLTRSRLEIPRAGRSVSFRRALATSNNQCFGRLAVDALGRSRLLGAFARFGWLDAPAPGYPAGTIEVGQDPLELAQLGSGLAGSSITPLHALRLALSLVEGRAPDPFWVASAHDASGIPLALPVSRDPLEVMDAQIARQLRAMLVETTQQGTARRAFRRRNGRRLLQQIEVAGKTGSLSGTDPEGRYEWFVGVAPADEPSIALAVVSVQGELYLQTSSQLAAEVLRRVFCPRGICTAEASERWLAPLWPLESPRSAVSTAVSSSPPRARLSGSGNLRGHSILSGKEKILPN